VRFAVRDLDGLRQGDWLNFYDDVAQFLTSSTRGSAPGDTWEQAWGMMLPSPPTLMAFQQTMRAVQPTLYHLLDAIAIDLLPNDALDTRCLLRRDARLLPGVEFVFGPGFRGVRGTLEHVFLWYAQVLLFQSPLEQVVHCRECQTLFYRVKQQVHCSRACTNRVSQRRLRARVAATSVTKPVTIERSTTARDEAGVRGRAGAGGGRGRHLAWPLRQANCTTGA
jgi:hypothetical protein